MKDINTPLRTSYFSSLSPFLQYKGERVPVYSSIVTAGNLPELYVYFSGQTNTENSPQRATKIKATININIISSSIHNANREAVDMVAAQVYSLIYPDRQAVIDLPGFTVIDNTVQNDITMDLSNAGTRNYIARVITFNHIIFLPK